MDAGDEAAMRVAYLGEAGARADPEQLAGILDGHGRGRGAAAAIGAPEQGAGDEDGAGQRAAGGEEARPALELWASPTGRALQTLAIVAERLGLDWHEARTDVRLGEIDMGLWGGRLYRDIELENGPIVDREAGLFTVGGPGDLSRRG